MVDEWKDEEAGKNWLLFIKKEKRAKLKICTIAVISNFQENVFRNESWIVWLTLLVDKDEVKSWKN